MLAHNVNRQEKIQLIENKGKIIEETAEVIETDVENISINQAVSNKGKTLAQELLIPLLAKGMNKTKVANSLRVSRTTVDRWERGVEPTFSHLGKLISLYSVIVCAAL